MKAAKTWCLAGLMVVAGLSSASCGKDEGTDGGGGRGTVIGGSGGSGGLPGRSGSGGSSTDGGADGVSATKLGRACVTDKDCTDPAAPDLRCITSKDAVLTDGAPPKGLCTQACTMPQTRDEKDPCEALGTGALCYPFTDGLSEGYCLEGCAFGRPDIGETKCHDRAEFACNPALYTRTETPCVATKDCPAGDLCFADEGLCFVPRPACTPSCRGDLDCDPGMYCDSGFMNGTCVAKKPTGKRLGEPCTVPAMDEPDDECIGFCQADAATGNAGHCAETCGLGRECAWNAATKKFDGLCFYPTILTNTAETAALGDFGFCTPSCNCSADCMDPALGCELLDDGPLNADFRGAGLCYAPGDMTVEYDQCTGAGGAGGAGGDSGAGGSGEAGSPNGGDASGGVGGAG